MIGAWALPFSDEVDASAVPKAQCLSSTLQLSTLAPCQRRKPFVYYSCRPSIHTPGAVRASVHGFEDSFEALPTTRHDAFQHGRGTHGSHSAPRRSRIHHIPTTSTQYDKLDEVPLVDDTDAHTHKPRKEKRTRTRTRTRRMTSGLIRRRCTAHNV